MRLYNTLTRKVEDFVPLTDNTVRMYSCGPTVYDHAHIGNLSAFIVADTLRRTLSAQGYEVKHVMNFTDVDDKTIRRSQQESPDLEAMEALHQLTRHYEAAFLSDLQGIGNDTDVIQFTRATENIDSIRQLITKLYDCGVAYIADDGVYFSIEKYKQSGHRYGQLLDIQDSTISKSRINNDEYDKDSVHDFALWKLQKGNEPAWEFELDSHILLGRPGWHIECSAMSSEHLGQPFDIHTGGVDLIFPHHENEIAQSTACTSDPLLAQFFVHNEHILVDGRKMSKSLNNFYTLKDIEEHRFNPLAFRLMVLQAHYRNQVNFSWESLQAALSRLQDLHNLAVLRYQALEVTHDTPTFSLESVPIDMSRMMAEDLNTPAALAYLSDVTKQLTTTLVSKQSLDHFIKMLEGIDALLGLDLMARPDIDDQQKNLINKRQQAREANDWAASDTIRNQLAAQDISIRDTPYGQIWTRVK